jgi:hypothetical protein
MISTAAKLDSVIKAKSFQPQTQVHKTSALQTGGFSGWEACPIAQSATLYRFRYWVQVCSSLNYRSLATGLAEILHSIRLARRQKKHMKLVGLPAFRRRCKPFSN